MSEKVFGFKETDFLVLTRLFRDDLDSTADLERFSEKCFPVVSKKEHEKKIKKAVETERLRTKKEIDRLEARVETLENQLRLSNRAWVLENEL